MGDGPQFLQLGLDDFEIFLPVLDDLGIPAGLRFPRGHAHSRAGFDHVLGEVEFLTALQQFFRRHPGLNFISQHVVLGAEEGITGVREIFGIGIHLGPVGVDGLVAHDGVLDQLLVFQHLDLGPVGGGLQLVETGRLRGQLAGLLQVELDVLEVLEAAGQVAFLTGQAVAADFIHGEERGPLDVVGDGDLGDVVVGQGPGAAGGMGHLPGGEAAKDEGDDDEGAKAEGDSVAEF